MAEQLQQSRSVATGVIHLSQQVASIGTQPNSCGNCTRPTVQRVAYARGQQPKVFNLLPPIPSSALQNQLIARFQEVAHNAEGLSPEAIQNTIQFIRTQGSQVRNRNFVTIIDYSQPSTSKRMYIFDLRNGRVKRELVAHGRGSGASNYATRFSNLSGSNQSSLGFFLTAETYVGKHGRSMRLDGLQPSNSLARARTIVVHAANYVSESFARTRGRLGLSQGCPAVAPNVIREVLETANGSLFYAFGG